VPQPLNFFWIICRGWWQLHCQIFFLFLLFLPNLTWVVLCFYYDCFVFSRTTLLWIGTIRKSSICEWASLLPTQFWVEYKLIWMVHNLKVWCSIRLLKHIISCSSLITCSKLNTTQPETKFLPLIFDENGAIPSIENFFIHSLQSSSSW
jgi:hypothetical protein